MNLLHTSLTLFFLYAKGSVRIMVNKIKFRKTDINKNPKEKDMAFNDIKAWREIMDAEEDEKLAYDAACAAAERRAA